MRCFRCGSYERSRLLWLVLERLDFQTLPLPFYHLAPELGIARQLARRLGPGYRAFDFAPEGYQRAGIQVGRLDLCTDLTPLDTGSIGVICHMHVLEHVRCDVKGVLREIHRVLKPGGYHVFGIPFWGRRYREDLSPHLTDGDRLARFGHEDHVRAFGHADFEARFGDAFTGMEHLALSSIVDPVAASRANIPPRALQPLNTHTVFVFRKPLAQPASGASR